MVRITTIEEAPEKLKRDFERREKDAPRDYVPELNQKTLKLLSKNFFYYMDFFGINKKEQAIWLGLDKVNYTTLKNYREKKTIKADWDAYNRIADLLGIVKSLKVIYPRSGELFQNWLSVRRKIFNGKSASEFITERPHDSYMNIKAVRRVLDLYRNGVINDLT
jgi:hypothetical protein